VKFPPFTPETGAISTLLLLEVQKVADAVVRSANLVLFFLVKVPIALN